MREAKRLFSLLFCVLVLSACGTNGGHFRIKGKFQNLNQGEFYIYSPDGGLTKIDTIRVNNGQFAYEVSCYHESTLMLVFPNFSEQPIFAMPGKTAEVKGDVSNLKELEVSGTKTNELMTAFRRQIAGKSPPETQKLAADFVKAHPESMTSIYLVRKYFLQGETPDYKQADELLKLMKDKQPKNGSLTQLQIKQKSLQNTTKNSRIPTFSAKDLEGGKISSSAISGADVAVVMTCASWHYDSMNMLRQLNTIQKDSHGRFKFIAIFLDGNVTEGKRVFKRDTIKSPVIFDEEMFDSTVMKQFGLSGIGDNIVYAKGKVSAHGLSLKALTEEVKTLLK